MLFCSLRALVKYLDNVPEAEIVELNIPTGIPLVYELDADLKPIRHYYLGDEVSRGTMAYSHWREILNTYTGSDKGGHRWRGRSGQGQVRV